MIMLTSRPSPSPLSLSASVFCLLSLLWASSSQAADPAGTFRYELRALGALAGEAVLTIGPLRAAQKRPARQVRLEARTAGVAGRIYKAWGDGTTIVDEGHQALKMKWKSMTRGVPRDADLSFHDRGVKGTYTHRKRFVLTLDEKSAERPLDAISAYLWLPQRPLNPGAIYERPFFDGRRLGALRAVVGEARSIQVPVGLREVVPVEISAKTRRQDRRVTFWVGIHDRVLYRVEVSHSVLGRVRADLVAQRRGHSP